MKIIHILDVTEEVDFIGLCLKMKQEPNPCAEPVWSDPSPLPWNGLTGSNSVFVHTVEFYKSLALGGL